nr:helix-turn-helix domain-containing protein [Paenibacillus physcomitrellae]
MNWSHFKSKLLLKYILSYLLMFLIPLTGVTLFVYENAVNSLRSEIEQSNVNQLNQVKATLDDRMSELQQIASKISYDEHLTPYMVHHPYYGVEAIRSLASYKANSGILEDLFLYFHNDSLIYSYRGLADLDVTFNRMYQFENWSAEQVRKDLNELNHPVMMPAEKVTVSSKKEPMLALIVPIKPNDPYPYGSILYLMKESTLMGVMDSILNDYSGSSYIFDENKQLLTANNHGFNLPESELNSLSSLDPGIHSLTLSGEPYSVVSVKSKENDWTYMTVMPSYQFFSHVSPIKSLILLVFCIAVPIGIFAAILLARRQYHPIRDLLEFAGLKNEPGVNFKMRSEWEWIRQMLHDYSARIHMQQPYVRNQCLLLLLKHGKPDDPEIKEMVAASGLELPENRGYYFCLILAWDEGQESGLSWRHAEETLSEFDIPDLDAKAYGLEFSPTGQFALMLSIDVDSPDEALLRVPSIVDTVKVTLVESSQPVPYIGVGTLYDDLADVNQSFIEAAAALEHRMVGSNGRVTYFGQLAELNAASADTYWLPKSDSLKLVQSLKQGNESVAREVISSIMNDVKEQALSMHLLRCVCFDLLNTLLRTASELGMDDVFQDIASFTSFDTLEELEAKLGFLALRICQQVEHKAETEQYSMIDDVVAYVDQQYMDYTLSLEHVALRYSISSSYLSRIFKEKTGSNFSQYIWQRRMDEVSRLLVTTSAPLKEIIEQVGYLDAPNFIRKFKKETGYTPGQYRKLHAGAQR